MLASLAGREVGHMSFVVIREPPYGREMEAGNEPEIESCQRAMLVRSFDRYLRAR